MLSDVTHNCIFTKAPAIFFANMSIYKMLHHLWSKKRDRRRSRATGTIGASRSIQRKPDESKSTNAKVEVLDLGTSVLSEKEVLTEPRHFHPSDKMSQFTKSCSALLLPEPRLLMQTACEKLS